MAIIVTDATGGEAVRVTNTSTGQQIITAPDPVSVRDAMMEVGAPTSKENSK